MQVPIAVTVQAKVTGQRRSAVGQHEVALELPPGPTSTRVFLEAVVRAEVRSFEQRAEERTFLRVLTDRSLADGLAEGRVLPGGAEPSGPVDAEAAVVEALLAFEDGFFKVFVGEAELERLDETITLAAAAEVLFLRLVPLAGG